ncbi:MAG: hypothetical protein IPN70_03585 [Candidatus Moraniibacteriota bacterium]|nr:MAG: hypothetical protein IPN70_03585 [Candidatus Moranbacteria bacterium]
MKKFNKQIPVFLITSIILLGTVLFIRNNLNIFHTSWEISAEPSSVDAKIESTTAGSSPILLNAGMEQQQSTQNKPLYWEGGSQIGLRNIQFHSMKGGKDSHSGDYYARLEMPANQSGSVWIYQSGRNIDVSGFSQITYSTYVRYSRLKKVSLEIKEFNSSNLEIARQTSVPLGNNEWKWNKGKQTFTLNSATKRVTFAVVAELMNIPGSNMAYLDVDDAFIETSRTPRNGPSMGVHSAIEYPTSSAIISEMANMDTLLGADMDRFGLNWSLVEKTKGSYSWDRYDTIINTLYNKEIKPLVIITTSPMWINKCPSDFSSQNRCLNYVPQNEGDFEKWVSEYEKFVRMAVSRYKNKVKHWEIGNEVNIQQFWEPAPNIKQFAKFSYRIHKAILAIDPNASVAIGGLTILNHAYASPQIAGKDFIAGLYREWKLIDPTFKPSIFSIHPYPFGGEALTPQAGTSNKNSFLDVETIHNTLNTHGTGNERIWITEFGWRSCKDISGSTKCNEPYTLQQQSTYLQQGMDYLLRNWSYVDIVTWFWLYDRPDSKNLYGFGLINKDKQITSTGNVYKQYSQ